MENRNKTSKQTSMRAQQNENTMRKVEIERIQSGKRQAGSRNALFSFLRSKNKVSKIQNKIANIKKSVQKQILMKKPNKSNSNISIKPIKKQAIKRIINQKPKNKFVQPSSKGTPHRQILFRVSGKNRATTRDSSSSGTPLSTSLRDRRMERLNGTPRQGWKIGKEVESPYASAKFGRNTRVQVGERSLFTNQISDGSSEISRDFEPMFPISKNSSESTSREFEPIFPIFKDPAIILIKTLMNPYK
eukprot:UN01989